MDLFPLKDRMKGQELETPFCFPPIPYALSGSGLQRKLFPKVSFIPSDLQAQHFPRCLPNVCIMLLSVKEAAVLDGRGTTLSHKSPTLSPSGSLWTY